MNRCRLIVSFMLCKLALWKIFIVQSQSLLKLTHNSFSDHGDSKMCIATFQNNSLLFVDKP